VTVGGRSTRRPPEDVVRALLAEQHPDLAGLPLVEAAAGWDNSLWRLGDGLAVRLPRRPEAAALVENEQRWLPVLAPRLPLPVPVPVRVGRPSREYPWCWSVVPWLAGVPADAVPLVDGDSATASARALGLFLHGLHRAAPPDAPHNPYRSVSLADRAGSVEERLVRLGDHVDADRLRTIWETAVGAWRWDRPPTWLHGDLHPGNVLVAGGTLTAVVDFGDVCAGDPATDLAGAWLLLPARAVPDFAQAYGGVGPDLERRALGWAVLFALMLLDIGLAGARSTYAAVGRSALERVVEWGT
jgi:aminoglycoside phosphotransferase (APT) family kinase protein